MGGVGAPIATRYWRGTRHPFLINLYNSKNIGGGGHVRPPAPCSAVPAIEGNLSHRLTDLEFADVV